MSNSRVDTSVRHVVDRVLDVAMKVIPIGVLIAVGAFFTAEQALRPNQRAIKAALMLALMAFLFRFDMVYSLYLFTFVYSFPSGISIASSNIVLMTIIPMIWAVRAASTRTTMFRRSALDAPHVLFLMAYFLSLMNVETNYALTQSLQVIWRQITCVGFFLLIVTLVDNQEKLIRLLKVVGASCALVMSTAITELVAPGAVIIPGWIGFTNKLGEGGEYSVRVSKMRIGGALGNDANLSDIGSQLLCLMAYFAWRAKNPAEKAFWTMATVLTLVAVLSTGNRGGLIGMAIALGYGTYLFRHRLSFAQLMMLITGALALVLGANYVLETFTYATSPIERLMHTKMVGMVPETRTMTWWPSIQKSMQHPFVGHGPYFEVAKGLTFQFWPHNAYLYYLQTIGLLGLGAFLWIMTRVARMSMGFRGGEGRRGTLGDLMAVLHVSLVVFAIEQLRSDHQNSEIYPYHLWLLFGVITVAARLLGERSTDAEGAGVTPREAGPVPRLDTARPT